MNHWSGAVGWSGIAVAFGLALCMHALSDGLQGRISSWKRRIAPDGSSKEWSQWVPWLMAHGGFHGLGVAIALGEPAFGCAEAFAHALIDWGKCEGIYGAWVDQMLHMVCKCAWVAGWWWMARPLG